MENKYNNGKIYKIEPLNGIAGDVYIGSTTQELDKRWGQHSSDYKRWLTGKSKSIIYSFKLFNKYDINNCLIVLLENVNVNTKIELLEREAYYINSLECVNKIIPGRTVKEQKKQYYLDNKEKIKEQSRTNYLQNTKYNSVLKEDNKIKSKQYRDNHKQVREDNKEYTKEYNKKYHQLHKEEKKVNHFINKDAINAKVKERRALKKFKKAEADQESQLNKVMGGCIDL